jgi:hypothetical protein
VVVHLSSALLRASALVATLVAGGISAAGAGLWYAAAATGVDATVEAAAGMPWRPSTPRSANSADRSAPATGVRFRPSEVEDARVRCAMRFLLLRDRAATGGGPIGQRMRNA